MTVNRFRALICDEHGQDLVEYALLVPLIVLGLLASMSSPADALRPMFTNISNSL
jgi:Flp pilus assembly pilin Flp